jgi:hypothetical protein
MPTSSWACVFLRKHGHADVAMAHVYNSWHHFCFAGNLTRGLHRERAVEHQTYTLGKIDECERLLQMVLVDAVTG